VDFGASDAAMSPAEMAKVEGGVQLLPITAGSIVLAYNLQGVTGLKLSRAAYVGIFLGKVTRWNDPLITKDNPGLSLPDEPINVIVHRHQVQGERRGVGQHYDDSGVHWLHRIRLREDSGHAHGPS
jgi:phosphate transport system substrate-binding protein